MRIKRRLFTYLLLFSGFLFAPHSLVAITIDTDRLFLAKQQAQIQVPSHYPIYVIGNVREAYQTLAKVHRKGGNAAIFFEEGVYRFNKTLNITSPNIMLLSTSTFPHKTVLRGNGMKASKGVDNLIRVAASGFVLDGLTLEQSGNHLIQIAGESGATKPIIRNCILQDGYEQLVKVTYSRTVLDLHAREGLIENCLFQYTAGIGPNYYIGGIDAHGIQGWIIRNNIFVNIASPSKHIAEHAIHLWNDTSNNLISENIIINSDRGIGLGMRQKRQNYLSHSNLGGTIENNAIYHAKNHHKFADTGIVLEDSPEVIVKDNIIYFEHDYPNAIEFRFEQTQGVIIKNNSVNRAIKRRDSGQAIIVGNDVSESAKEQFIIKLQGIID